MLSRAAYIRIVRASALYDLVATAPFATPWSFAFVAGVLGALHVNLQLPGAWFVPDMMQTLFACLMGSVVVIWSLARLHLGLPILGLYDAAARLLFAFWQLNAVWHGASYLILAFTAVELIFFVLQLLPYRRS